MSPQKSKLISDATPKTTDPNRSSSFNTILWFSMSLLFGYLHTTHVQTLFENDKHFSHLSNLERELSFRTESGLYYYYFKTLVVDAKMRPVNESFFSLTRRLIINDNRTEHPSTINSLQRFNLYPEVLLAFLYRVANSLNLLHRECWQINRGDEMPPVESCIGLKEPIYFYAHSVFVLHGFSMAFLFTLCYLLNNRSVLSGIVGCACYFFNHAESTRVMWTPALRESFSFPFHLLQLTILTHFLNIKQPNKKHQFALTASTLFFLLPWQFAQFSLATQTASLFALYSTGFLHSEKLIKILAAQTFALLLCFILMFGNRMLISSLFASFLLSIWLIVLIEKSINSANKVFLLFFRIFSFLLLTFIIKKFLMSGLIAEEDDSHIWEILKSKFNPALHNFHTRLYTCAKEFDFLEYKTLQKLTYTLLFPTSLITVFFYSFQISKKFFSQIRVKNDEEFSAVFYHILQLAAFSLMAFLIMRLKLFWTPQMCVLASLLVNKSFVNFLFSLIFKNEVTQVFRLSFAVLILALMSFNGGQNLRQQYQIQGEYSDYTMEKMITWINENTEMSEAFAGTMPTMANVKLSTDRAIADHPHYEDAALRRRVMRIYSHLYGYRPIEEIYSILSHELNVKYLVVEKHYCLASPPGKPECALAKIAHLSLHKTAAKPACLALLEQNTKRMNFFQKKFEFRNMVIFKVV